MPEKKSLSCLQKIKAPLKKASIATEIDFRLSDSEKAFNAADAILNFHRIERKRFHKLAGFMSMPSTLITNRTAVRSFNETSVPEFPPL
jgi:hypothetical protein